MKNSLLHLTVGCGPAFAEKFRELLCVFAQEAIILKQLRLPANCSLHGLYRSKWHGDSLWKSWEAAYFYFKRLFAVGVLFETSRQEPVSDIYSLAATLYSIFAGNAPLDVRQRLFEDNFAAVRSYNHRRISAPFEKLIQWGLAMSPEERCGSLR
ncbi:hypothetical protein [Paenibacillus sp. FSL H8-0537]|uniref:hypothetical protein n=1 Tax=Paenibacillus sp. FSL H8-0537 TaxID=2921399 RepID=UPI00310170CD